MTPQIQRWMRAVREQIPFVPGRVLEIGSQNVNGTVRGYFGDATEYIGIDMQAAPGVDIVMNASGALETFGKHSFDTILCCEMLEHDLNFLSTVRQIHKMLKPGGMLIITTPTFGFPLHRYPKDYWRFGEDAYREVFFSGCELINLMHLDDAAGPKISLVAVGRKQEVPVYPPYDDLGNKRLVKNAVDPVFSAVD